MSEAAEKIAGELRAAYAKGWRVGRGSVAGYYAPTIEVRHQPPLPQDGMRSGEQVGKESVEEFKAYGKLMSDFREEGTIAVDGDRVVLDLLLLGTSADGTHLHAPVQQILTVQDGIVTKNEVILTPEALAQLVALNRAGGRSVEID